jgi:hypothetical protein
MKPSDVLLCLSLEEQRIEAIIDRLAKRGHITDLKPMRKNPRSVHHGGAGGDPEAGQRGVLLPVGRRRSG